MKKSAEIAKNAKIAHDKVKVLCCNGTVNK